ncbi:hypothetical protein OKW21_003866 [Catalinimonas alkaloidigena]|uniref:hypothetical protein n=1 Tax=Catalinimonas alkaloidigena TaxID=1075417 RepID=UPI002404D449|nr:hypothetical protein [Catalinimonas alkaloidigena]MDF9798603.1 hypothetical protein [Catalinimonas alkaloidigena]
MIYHFLIALVVAVIIMPKSGADLNELNTRLTKKLKAEPTYLMEIEGRQYELDYQERSIIDPRWIDKIELFKAPRLPEAYKASASVVVMVSLKKRKVDEFWEVIEAKQIQL